MYDFRIKILIQIPIFTYDLSFNVSWIVFEGSKMKNFPIVVNNKQENLKIYLCENNTCIEYFSIIFNTKFCMCLKCLTDHFFINVLHVINCYSQ